MQFLSRRDVEIEQPRQRQKDLLDLLDGNFLDDAGELLKLARLQRHRRVGAQPRPFIAREDPVGRELQSFVAKLRRRVSYRACRRACAASRLVSVPRCLLLEARCSHAPLEDGKYVIEGDIAGFKQHQQMVEHVGRFRL